MPLIVSLKMELSPKRRKLMIKMLTYILLVIDLYNSVELQWRFSDLCT